MKLFNQIKKVFPIIEERFDKKSIFKLVDCDYEDLYRYHFCLGMWIRNCLLIEDTKLFNLFKLNGVNDLDDMSMLIIQLFYLYMKDKYTQDKTYSQFLDFKDFVCYTERKSKGREFLQ